jgi:transposase
MGKPYSDDLRAPVVAALERGMSCREAGALFGVAPSTAGNWHRRHRQTQSLSARPMGGDRRSKLTAHGDRITALLGEGSQLRLVDVRAALAAEGVVASTSAVQRMVRRLGLRFKKNIVRDRTGPA